MPGGGGGLLALQPRARWLWDGGHSYGGPGSGRHHEQAAGFKAGEFRELKALVTCGDGSGASLLPSGFDYL